MSDFLTNLVSRVTGQAQRLQPVIPPLFAPEPGPRGGGEEPGLLDRTGAGSSLVRPRTREPEGGPPPFSVATPFDAPSLKEPPIAAPGDPSLARARPDAAPLIDSASSTTTRRELARQTSDAESLDAETPARGHAKGRRVPGDLEREDTKLSKEHEARSANRVREVDVLLPTVTRGQAPQRRLPASEAIDPEAAQPRSRQRFHAPRPPSHSNDEPLLMDGTGGRGGMVGRPDDEAGRAVATRLPAPPTPAPSAPIPTRQAVPLMASPSTSPVIEVTIGRVEVRAVQAPAAHPPARRAPKPGSPAKLSLEEYLRRSRGGG